MQSEIQEFIKGLREYNIQKGYLRGFELFEEYSGRSISETIKRRKKKFISFDPKVKRQVEREVESFYNWLKKVKRFHPNTAYYYSVSLKSLLAGLPIGVEIGLLFGIILDAQARKSSKATLA